MGKPHILYATIYDGIFSHKDFDLIIKGEKTAHRVPGWGTLCMKGDTIHVAKLIPDEADKDAYTDRPNGKKSGSPEDEGDLDVLGMQEDWIFFKLAEKA